jgi:GNAT superfamily N-acetyltransferase
LDAALETLPEAEHFPHALFRQLMQLPTEMEKQTVLIHAENGAIAVAGLRLRGRIWEPIGDWMTPGAFCPMREGTITQVVEAIARPLSFAWWRQKGAPAEGPRLRMIDRQQTYGTMLDIDIEAMWRERKIWKSIRQAINRTKSFTLRVNAPGALDWVLQRWGEKWGGDRGADRPDMRDRLLTARYLQEIGQHFTLTLHDGERIVAGNTNLKHGDTMIGQAVYRDREYERHGVGIRLLQLTFEWAKEAGFARIDIGGGREYKERWAPVDGEWQVYAYSPMPDFYLNKLRNLPGKLRAGIRSIGRRPIVSNDVPPTTWKRSDRTRT